MSDLHAGGIADVMVGTSGVPWLFLRIKGMFLSIHLQKMGSLNPMQRSHMQQF